MHDGALDLACFKKVAVRCTGRTFISINPVRVNMGIGNGGFKVRDFTLIGRCCMHPAYIPMLCVDGEVTTVTVMTLSAFL